VSAVPSPAPDELADRRSNPQPGALRAGQLDRQRLRDDSDVLSSENAWGSAAAVWQTLRSMRVSRPCDSRHDAESAATGGHQVKPEDKSGASPAVVEDDPQCMANIERVA